MFSPPQHWFWGVITDNGEIVVAKEISAEFNKLPAEEQARIYLAVFKKLQDIEVLEEQESKNSMEVVA